MAGVHREANPLDDPGDAAALRGYAEALADAIAAALPLWVERAVAQRYEAWAGHPPPAGVIASAGAAGRAALGALEPRLRELLGTDVDAQRTNPLAILRSAVPYPSAVLHAAGVPAVVRDGQAERLFPDDVYGLSVATFADLHPSVHEPGLGWGAAKAHVVLARRRAGRPG